jgi:hypothetical protein
MTDQPFDFGELRSLLQQPPSAQVWEALCKLVFPARWEKTADQWLPYAQDHLDRHWPDELRLVPLKWAARKRPPSALQLARHLRYTGSPSDITALVDMLALARPPLTALHTGNVGADVAAQLLEACANPQLRELELGACKMSDVSSAALAALDALATVEALKLSNAPISDNALGGLLTSPKLAGLRRLSMHWQRSSSAQALGATLCRVAERLDSLELSYNKHPDPAALAPALGRASWPALRSLYICGVDTDAAGISALLAATPALRALALRDDKLDGDAVSAITSSAASLDHLNLTYLQGAAAELAALLLSARCAELRSLELFSVQLDEVGGEAIWRGQTSQTLERLGLRGPRLGEGAWRALEGARLPRLRALDVFGGELDDAATSALARAELPALTLLDLSHATLSDGALAALERAPWRAQVTLITS